MSRYYLNLWSKVHEFSFLPQGKQEDFKMTVLEGMEMAMHQVRVALDACHFSKSHQVRELMLGSVFGYGIPI